MNYRKRATLPARPQFWPKSMWRDDCWATDVQMAQAWKHWANVSDDERTTSRLAPFLLKNGGRDESPSKSWRFHRLADAMVQRARKAGVIYSHKRRWHFWEGTE